MIRNSESSFEANNQLFMKVNNDLVYNPNTGQFAIVPSSSFEDMENSISDETAVSDLKKKE